MVARGIDSGTGPPPPLWPAVVVLAVALGAYATTCARTVTLVDSGELVVACATMGVAHPPGFPVYTMVGNLFSRIPLGSVAFRLSLMSALFAALTAAIVALVVGELGSGPGKAAGRRRKGRGGSEHSDEQDGARRRRRLHVALPQLGAGLTLVFSLTLWGYATVAEVYSLNLALVTGGVWLLLRWRRDLAGSRGDPRLMCAGAGFLFGLALGVHHVSVVLVLPAIAVFVLRTAGARSVFNRCTVPAIGGAGVGLLAYLYLPLAASRQPVLNWGNPSSWERFVWHVTARQYQVNLFSGDASQVRENLGDFTALLADQFTPLGLLVVVAGVVWLWRHDRTVLWMLVLVSVLGVAYAVNYEIAEDTDAYGMTTFVAAAVALGGGLRWISDRWMGSGRVGAAAVGAVALLLPVGNLAAHLHRCDRSDDRVARHFVEDALAGVSPGGLVLTMDWQLYSPYLYLRHVEGFRPDATVVDVNLVRRSWYVSEYLQQVYPEAMAKCARESEAFLVKLDDWEHDRPHDPDQLTRLFTALHNCLVDTHLPDREAHVTLPMEPGVGARWTGVPRGLTIELSASSRQSPKAVPELHVEPLTADPATLQEVAVVKVRPYYASMLANRGRFLAMVGDAPGARRRLEQALRLEPTYSAAHQFVGDLELSLGRLQDARAAYARAVRHNENNREARRSLQAVEERLRGR